MQPVSALIVGAGPAGLKLSRELNRRGISNLVVEKDGAGSSWHKMPKTMHLVSPWWTNTLDIRHTFKHLPWTMVSAEDYYKYLQEYSSQFNISIHSGYEVQTVRPCSEQQEFLIETSKGFLKAKSVIFATGYFSCPAAPLPNYASDGTIPNSHVSKLRDGNVLARLPAGARVVIVGKRISAGQLMVQLHDKGFNVVLSCRPPVQFRADGLYGAMKDSMYYLYEEFLLKLRPRLKSPSFPVMDGGRSRWLIENNKISVKPPINKIRDYKIQFEDGSYLAADYVIDATGYHPAFPDLSFVIRSFDKHGLPMLSHWESVDTPGIYFLGLDNRMNYRSRTLRGIRSDAQKLANQIRKREQESFETY